MTREGGREEAGGARANPAAQGERAHDDIVRRRFESSGSRQGNGSRTGSPRRRGRASRKDVGRREGGGDRPRPRCDGQDLWLSFDVTSMVSVLGHSNGGSRPIKTPSTVNSLVLRSGIPQIIAFACCWKQPPPRRPAEAAQNRAAWGRCAVTRNEVPRARSARGRNRARSRRAQAQHRPTPITNRHVRAGEVLARVPQSLACSANDAPAYLSATLCGNRGACHRYGD